MALFTFLHISDLHIGATPEQLGLLPLAKEVAFRFSWYSRVATVSSHSAAILDGLALLAWQESHALDGIIITGDLATTGNQPDLDAARDFLLEAPSPTKGYQTVAEKPTLNNPANPNIYLIPGNHDRFDGPSLNPAGSNFDSTFGTTSKAQWPVGQSAYAIDVLKKGGVSLGIVGADLSLQSAAHISPTNPFQLWGAGRAYPNVIDEMVRITKQIRAEHAPVEVIWLVHFPPRFPKPSSFLRLLDEDLLIQAADNENIGYLLCGHTHHEDRYLGQKGSRIFGGKSVEVLCAGTATEHRPPSSTDPRTVHFLEFDVTTGRRCSVTKKTLNWNDSVPYWV